MRRSAPAASRAASSRCSRSAARSCYRRLLEVNRQGVTILLVEQNARLAFKLAQFVYVMEQGRVVLEGPSADVAASEHVQKAYLGAS